MADLLDRTNNVATAPFATYDNTGTGVAEVGGNVNHDNVAEAFLGKTVAAFDIDFAVDGTNFSSTEVGADGAVRVVLNQIAQWCTITGISAFRADAGSAAGQIITILVEGDFGSDTYDGSNSETLAAFLQTVVRENTSVGAGSVNLSSATVTAVDGFPMNAYNA